MKRIVIGLGVLIALLAIWQTVSNQAPDEQEAHQAKVQSPAAEIVVAETPTASDVSGAIPPRANEPAAVADEIPESCTELDRRLEQAPNMSVGFAEGREADEDACGVMVQMIWGEMVRAMPGLAGFNVRDPGDFVVLNPRGQLFAEADTPEWSRPMESRIYREIDELLDFPINTLHAVCRTSTCGLLFAYSSADHSGANYNYYARELADTLGFSGYYGGVSMPRNGIWFMRIYLGDWETRRPETDVPSRTLPRSFDEAREQVRPDADTE
jgi:hypothetical protein